MGVTLKSESRISSLGTLPPYATWTTNMAKYLAPPNFAAVGCMAKGSITYFCTQIFYRKNVSRHNTIAHEFYEQTGSVGI
jgi:hypothetical protein